jgi:transcriptional regulator with XRE-family HTH domain
MPETRAQDFGSRLRGSREQRGISLRHIADVTKLSVRALDGLERGDPKCLPNGIFRRALVRAYASEVGLNPEATLAEFLTLFPDDLPTLVSTPGGRQLLADDVVPSRAAQIGQLAFKVLGAALPAGAGILYIVLTTNAPAPSHLVFDAEPVQIADVWRPEIVPAGGFMEPPPPAPRALAVFVTITSPCELRVQVDGRETVSRRFRAGEQFQLEAREEVILTGDDAGAVQFSINGQAGRMLGHPGDALGARIARDDYDAFLIGH